MSLNIDYHYISEKIKLLYCVFPYLRGFRYFCFKGIVLLIITSFQWTFLFNIIITLLVDYPPGYHKFSLNRHLISPSVDLTSCLLLMDLLNSFSHWIGLPISDEATVSFILDSSSWYTLLNDESTSVTCPVVSSSKVVDILVLMHWSTRFVYLTTTVTLSLSLHTRLNTALLEPKIPLN